MVFCLILPSCIFGGGPRLKSPVSNAFWVENYRAKEKKKKKKKKEKSTKHREFFFWACKVFPNGQPISIYDLRNKYDNDPCFKKHAKKVNTDGDDDTLMKLCRMLASEYNSRFVQDRTSNNSLSHLTSALYKSSNIKKLEEPKIILFYIGPRCFCHKINQRRQRSFFPE